MGVSDWPFSPLRVKPTLGLNYIQNLLIGDLQKKYVKSDEKFNLQQSDQILLSVLLQFSQTPSNLLPILLQFSQTPSNLLPILLQFSQPKFYLKLNSFISTTRVSWRRYKEHTISRWTHSPTIFILEIHQEFCSQWLEEKYSLELNFSQNKVICVSNANRQNYCTDWSTKRIDVFCLTLQLLFCLSINGT